jgi:hypothetical protein
MGVGDRGAGVVGADARGDRHAAGGHAHGGGHQLGPLVVGERGRLAGGAAGDDALHAGADLAVDQALVRRQIQGAVAMEGGDDRGVDALHVSLRSGCGS